MGALNGPYDVFRLADLLIAAHGLCGLGLRAGGLAGEAAWPREVDLFLRRWRQEHGRKVELIEQLPDSKAVRSR